MQSWPAAYVLGVPSAVLIALNWAGLLESRRAGRSYSFAPPFLCGIVGAVACLVCPEPRVRSLAWVPLVADPSLAPLAIVIGVRAAARLGGRRQRSDRGAPDGRPDDPEGRGRA